ncbi:MAG: cation diffusion facilitator family transporter, partial [Clostridia bacterium]|nr:cation diffusion facilitator family transporter [Clostridia bacterium]
MINFLSGDYIKNSEDIQNPAGRAAYGVMVSIIGILINILLAAGKMLVGFLAFSVSIQADVVNNLSDAGSAIVSLVCFRISAKPADRDHPFGHARMEYVASMIVSFFIFLIGFELLKGSAVNLYQSVFQPEKYQGTVFSWASVTVLTLAIAGKLVLMWVNRAFGKKIGSKVMEATAQDSLSDVLSTSAVLAATLVSHFVSLPFSLDGAMGILVSVLILKAGFGILKVTQNSILGEAPAEETVEQIKAVIAGFPEALGIHDMYVHEYGPGTTMASLHIEVDGSKNVFDSHEAVDQMERELFEKCHIHATIHMDPIVVGDPETERLRQVVSDFVAQIGGGITIHDFRLVRGNLHSNLIFDIAVPY